MKRKLIYMGMFLCGVCSFILTGGRTEAKKVDTAGKYHAALGVATDYSKSVHRDAYYEKKYLQDGNRDKLVVGVNGESGYQILDGTFEDTVIKGNGTYAVTLTNADFNYNRSFRKLYVATDIPNTRQIKFTNFSVSINGQVLRTFDKAVLADDSHRKNCVLLAIDTENAEVRNAFSRSTVPGNKQNEIKLRFQVKGFNYKKGEAPPTPTPVPTETPEIQEIAEAGEELPETTGTEEPEQVMTETSESIGEVPIENKIGIGITVVIGIGAIILCMVIVGRRQH